MGGLAFHAADGTDCACRNDCPFRVLCGAGRLVAEMESSSTPGPAAGAASTVAHTDARPHAEDMIDRVSWTIDDVGRELLARDDVRRQLRDLMRWPGRVSGWRRASHVWSVDTRSGGAYIFGAEGAGLWARPGVAELDPGSIVSNAALGAPPAIRTATLASRRETYVVASVCTPLGLASLVELRPSETVLSAARLAERFPVVPVAPGSDGFVPVRVASIYAVNTSAGLETAVLLIDPSATPRGWFATEHAGALPAGLEIGPDNRNFRTSLAHGAGMAPAYHLDEIRNAVIASFKGLS